MTYPIEPTPFSIRTCAAAQQIPHGPGPEAIGAGIDMIVSLGDALEFATQELRAGRNQLAGAHHGSAAQAAELHLSSIEAAAFDGTVQASKAVTALEHQVEYHRTARDKILAISLPEQPANREDPTAWQAWDQAAREASMLANEAGEQFRASSNNNFSAMFASFDPPVSAPADGAAGAVPPAGAGIGPGSGPAGTPPAQAATPLPPASIPGTSPAPAPAPPLPGAVPPPGPGDLLTVPPADSAPRPPQAGGAPSLPGSAYDGSRTGADSPRRVPGIVPVIPGPPRSAPTDPRPRRRDAGASDPDRRIPRTGPERGTSDRPGHRVPGVRPGPDHGAHGQPGYRGHPGPGSGPGTRPGTPAGPEPDRATRATTPSGSPTAARAVAGHTPFLPTTGTGRPDEQEHRRPDWLLEDDPDAIWFAGLPAYVDPVIRPEPHG